MPIPARPAYVKTMTDHQWANATLPERALHVARSQDAVQEFPKGSNWGPMVRVYLAACKIFKPAAWCSAFTTWCLIVAGANKKRLPKNPASTYQWLIWASDQGRLRRDPERGFLGCYFDRKKRGGHIWFDLGEKLGYGRRTLEGNTNTVGSREGFRVAERFRSVASMNDHDMFGWIDVAGLD